MKRLTTLMSVIGILLLPVVAHAEYKLYGHLHLSLDSVPLDSGTEYTVASNATRFGLKGTEELERGMKAFWKLESAVDMSGENTEMAPRNRYMGLYTRMGSVIGGVHDTPYKSLGDRINIMSDTIGDQRAIFGFGSFQGVDGLGSFDLRASNAIMYMSPDIGGLELRVMKSAGVEPAPTGQDQGTVYSFSAVFTMRYGFAAMAYEDQPVLETSATRIAVGVNLGNWKLNGMVEAMDSAAYSTLDRKALGVNAARETAGGAIKLQYVLAGDYYRQPDSGSSLLALGLYKKLGKRTNLYLILSQMTNSTYGDYQLAGGEHGEVYTIGTGGSASAWSIGGTLDF